MSASTAHLGSRRACRDVCRRHQAVGPPPGQHDSRLQVKAAARLHWTLRLARARVSRPEDGWPDGQHTREVPQAQGTSLCVAAARYCPQPRPC